MIHTAILTALTLMKNIEDKSTYTLLVLNAISLYFIMFRCGHFSFLFCYT